MTMPGAKPARTTTGGLLLAYLRWLDQHGWKEEVVAALSPEAAALAKSPPLVTAQLDARLTDEVLAALGRKKGLEAVRQLGYDAGRDSLLPVLKPLVDSFCAIHGRSPSTILARLPQLAGPMISGARATYSPLDLSSGEVEIRYDVSPAAAVFSLWEGLLRVFCETCASSVRVEPSAISEGGRAGRLRVTWS